MRICCLGEGAWGTALALLLARKKHRIQYWVTAAATIESLRIMRQHPRLLGHRFPNNIILCPQLAAALDAADIIVEALSAAALRSVLLRVRKLIGTPKVPLVLTSQGLEPHRHLLLPEVVAQVFDAAVPLVYLGGPAHVEEIANQLPAVLICATPKKALQRRIQCLFSAPSNRVYPSSDLLGLPFVAAIKQMVVIACGLVDGLRLGGDSKAVLLLRGFQEMRQLASAGIKPCAAQTVDGLAGLSDLCASCYCYNDANHRLGTMLAQGVSLHQAQQILDRAIEGISTCKSLYALAQRANLTLPLLEAVYHIVHRRLNPRKAIDSLL